MLHYEGGVIGTLQVAQHDPLRDFNHSFALSVLCEGGRSVTFRKCARLSTDPVKTTILGSYTEQCFCSRRE